MEITSCSRLSFLEKRKHLLDKLHSLSKEDRLRWRWTKICMKCENRTDWEGEALPRMITIIERDFVIVLFDWWPSCVVPAAFCTLCANDVHVHTWSVIAFRRHDKKSNVMEDVKNWQQYIIEFILKGPAWRAGSDTTARSWLQKNLRACPKDSSTNNFL